MVYSDKYVPYQIINSIKISKLKKGYIYCLFFLIFALQVACAQNEENRIRYFPKNLEKVKSLPPKERVWVFVLAGQSNMAGRGLVEPADTLSNPRIITFNKEDSLIYAKEPLHFYEPERTGLDCGMSFAQNIIAAIPDSITVLLVPTAIGGSSISQWLGDSVQHGVKLLSNFTEKITEAKKYGTVKAILWHQGESDANARGIPVHLTKLTTLFKQFRSIAGNQQLPVILGEIGGFSADKDNWASINTAINAYSKTDAYSAIVSTTDFQHKGDRIHFNAAGQRLMGQRMAAAFLKTLPK